MKIKKEHLDYMRLEINKTIEKHGIENIIKMYREGNFPGADKVQDLQKRLCFDLMYYSGLTNFVCSNIYKYANDEHLYTALKTICPKI